MGGGVYTRGEALRLAALGREGALDLDAKLRSSWSVGDQGTSAEETLFAIARWTDVNRALRRVLVEKRDAEVVTMRLADFRTEEIAERTGLSKATVKRRWRTLVALLMVELGGEADRVPERPDVTDRCLKCGEGHRVRLAAVRRERWTYVGRRRDPADGLLSQAWCDSAGEVQLFRRGLAVDPPIGGVYWATVGRDELVRSLERAAAFDFDHQDFRVRTWLQRERQHVDAGAGRVCVLARPEPRGRGPGDGDEENTVRDEKQTALCARCLLPELRPLILPRQPPARRVVRGYGSSRGARMTTIAS